MALQAIEAAFAAGAYLQSFDSDFTAFDPIHLQKIMRPEAGVETELSGADDIDERDAISSGNGAAWR